MRGRLVFHPSSNNQMKQVEEMEELPVYKIEQ